MFFLIVKILHTLNYRMDMNWQQSKVKLAYKGPFYIDILSELGCYLRQMYKYKPLTSNRLYKIFFELTQNVAKYSIESSNIFQHYKYGGIGYFSLVEEARVVKISTTNLIKSEDGPILEGYCSEINSMNKEKLRHYRNIKRRVNPEPKDTGAYIGIIQIGIITNNKIEYTINPLTDKLSLFTLTATVNIE